jgi:hypothetical protein
MDDATRAYLDAIEARLMARLNDNQEKLLERMRINETALASLANSVGALTEVARGTNTTLATITTLLTTLAANQSDQGRRLTDLEKR